MAHCTTPGHWDGRFFAMAKLVASWSKDPRKQVGAVLVSEDCRHISIGYNGFPAGFEERLQSEGNFIMDKETKNRYSLHAEENAIAQAAQDVRNWTLYVTEPPCMRCALSIHRAGIRRVVTPPLSLESSWFDEQSEAEGFLAMMGVVQERCVA